MLMQPGYAHAVNTHYQPGGLEAAIRRELAAAGKDLAALEPDDLAPVDQFHTRGKFATLELAELAAVTANIRVLDVGGGLGGPARLLAQHFLCPVVVLDLTEEYCRVGQRITVWLRLTDRVRFLRGNALDLPFAAQSFNLVWMQHTAMNIADKARLYAEIHRVLPPGGRLVLHEIFAGPATPVRFPVPWARDPAISFLHPPDEVRARIAATGFHEHTWEDGTEEALVWFRQRAAAYTAGPPPPLGLHLLLGPEFPTMIQNLARNLDEGRVVVFRGLFVRE